MSLSAGDIATLLRQEPPTAEQAAVIEAPLRPALVVAGAGSGKTETMSARVVWLIANGYVSPEEVLGLTFTRKAAGELGERVRRRLRQLARATGSVGSDLDLARPTVSTYHAYAASLVCDHAVRLGVEPGARLLGEAAQWQLAHEVVESWVGDLDTDAALSTVVQAVLALSASLDEHLLSPREAQQGIARIVADIEDTPAGPRDRPHAAGVRDLLRSLAERGRLLDVVAAYRDRKRAADALDHGDQVALAARLAQQVPEVGAGERGRYRVVLLDEYQDTSYSQTVLLAALFGGGHPVTAVGDPHQSVYGWRGASAGGLERFPQLFWQVGADGTRRPADVHRLSTSWRNDRAVLDAANRLAAPLRAASRVDAVELVARPEAGPGTVHARYALTVEDEARAAAQFLLAQHVAQGTRTAAVLCRKRAQFPVLHRALRAAGLPVEVVGLGGLLSTPEVVDLVAALRAAHDPSRGDALLRLVTGAHARLGAADLHALADRAAELVAGPQTDAAGGQRHGAPALDGPDLPRDPDVQPVVEHDVVDERSIVDALDDLPPVGWRSRHGRSLSVEGRTRLVRLAGTLRAVRSHAGAPLPELVGEAERLLGLDIEVAAHAGSDPARARTHLDTFREVAASFAEGADAPTLGAFLSWLEAAETQERGLDLPVVEPNPAAVQLTTVHGAKGLEWDVVVVAGLIDGGLPATRVGSDGPSDAAWLKGLGALPYPLRGDRADLPVFDTARAPDRPELERRRQAFVEDAGWYAVAEERRLAYVALTRARSAVLLSGAWWGAGKTARSPSLFLTELTGSGLAQVDEWCEPPEGPNPADPAASAVEWPADPFDGTRGSRRPAVAAAAGAVRAAMDHAQGGRAGGRTERPGEPGPSGQPGQPGHAKHPTGPVPADPSGGAPADPTGPVPADPSGGAPADPTGPVSADPWLAARLRSADMLLAERARRAAPVAEVAMPAHLSASALVRLAADPGGFARSLSRPVPQEPSPRARRGTQLHAWIEQFFHRASLVDMEDLPGADDDVVASDADLAALQERFLATPWAALEPVAVEVDVETWVEDYVLRSRIDAVFRDPERPGEADAVVVVDWKTGSRLVAPADVAAREVQLAVYRLAWSRRTGTPLDRVDAAFCYLATGHTVRPAALLDADGIAALLRSVTADPARSA